MQNLSRAAAVGKKMEHKISEPRPAPLPSAPPSSLRPIGSLNLTPEKEQRRKPLAEAQQNHILSPQSSLTPRSKASKLLNVPHHVTRYTQLQQVEVSETSFEELLIEKKAKGRTKETSDRTRKIPEPSLHKFKDEDMITREEAYWSFEPPNKPRPQTTPSTLYFEVN